jgi:hypothetical protein
VARPGPAAGYLAIQYIGALGEVALPERMCRMDEVGMAMRLATPPAEPDWRIYGIGSPVSGQPNCRGRTFTSRGASSQTHGNGISGPFLTCQWGASGDFTALRRWGVLRVTLATAVESQFTAVAGLSQALRSASQGLRSLSQRCGELSQGCQPLSQALRSLPQAFSGCHSRCGCCYSASDGCHRLAGCCHSRWIASTACGMFATGRWMDDNSIG